MVTNTEIWMGAHQALTLVPESQLFLGYSASILTTAAPAGSAPNAHLYKLDLDSIYERASGAGNAFSAKYTLVVDAYAGCLVDFYTNGGTFVETLMVHSNDKSILYFANAWDDSTLDANAYAIMRKYGAPVPGPITNDGGGHAQSTLLSDNCLGLVTTATFPNV